MSSTDNCGAKKAHPLIPLGNRPESAPKCLDAEGFGVYHGTGMFAADATEIRVGPVPRFSEINPPRAMTAHAPNADTGRALPVMAGASPANDATLAATGKTVAAGRKSIVAGVTRSFPGAGSFPAGAGSVPARCKSIPAMAARSFSGAGSIPAPCKSGAARAGIVLPLAALIPAGATISAAGAGMIPAITGSAAQVAAGQPIECEMRVPRCFRWNRGKHRAHREAA